MTRLLPSDLRAISRRLHPSDATSLADFAELLAPEPATVGYADVAAAKVLVVRTVAPSVSAV
jgi:hypothetical protein